MANPSPDAAPHAAHLRGGMGVRLGFVLGLALLLGYAALAVGQISRPGYVLRTDFLIILTGADILAAGHPAQLYDEASQQASQAALLRPTGQRLVRLLPFNHPPFEALLVQGLQGGGFTPSTVLALWSLLNALAVAGGLAALRWAWPVRGTPGGLLLLALLTFFPLTVAFLLGQNTGLLLLGWVGGSAALRRGHPGWAGALFALATLKPQTIPVILLALLVSRQWRALAGYAATVGVAVASTLPFLGADWPLRYVGFLLRLLTWSGDSTIDPAVMQNWRGLFTRLLGSGLGSDGLTVGATLLSLLALLVCGYRLRQTDTAQPGTVAGDRYWAAVLLIGLLVSPHVLRHDLTLALVPGWILAAQALATNNVRRLAGLGMGWLAGLIAGAAPGLLFAPAVLWLAGTAGWLLWSGRNSNTSPTQTRAANVDNTLINPL